MEQKKIGNLISEIRKERKLTQQELGNILGVSSKTISKWECGNGLPDITMLNKISKELNISIDELLEGRINKPKPQNKIIPMILVCLLILIIIIIITICTKQKDNLEKTTAPTKICTIIKTYNIKNIEPSNDGNYLYITITEYQVEGAYTIKLPKSLANNLQENNNYVFTFKSNDNYEQTNKLFDNSEIINIKYTDKKGMETESTSYCE